MPYKDREQYLAFQRKYKDRPGVRDRKRKRHRERYANDPVYRARHNAQSAPSAERRREARMELFYAIKAERGCACCSENDPVCLDFHHRDPETREFAIAGSWSRSLERIEAELAKCIVLCANCHRKVHAGALVLAA